MFAKLSDTIARSFVARGTISEERFSICRYGIKQLFSVCLNLLTTLCIGMVFGLVTLLSSVAVRMHRLQKKD